MTPEDLYLLYYKKAEDMAARICYAYRASGAMPFREEAKSHARMALWKLAVKFDPSKQLTQRKEDTKYIESFLDSFVFGSKIPEPKNPYDIFWIYSITRVRGSVIDFFRSEKLIRKLSLKGKLSELPKGEIKSIQNRMYLGESAHDLAEEYDVPVAHIEELKPSVLHFAKFISLSEQKSFMDEGGFSRSQSPSGSAALSDSLCLESSQHMEQEVSNKEVAEKIKANAGLTIDESRSIEVLYSLHGYTTAEAAEKAGMTRKEFDKNVFNAIEKMKKVAVEMAMS